MTISRIQANAAADLVRAIRPGWDAMTTASVITDMSESVPFAKVVEAAIAAASNPDNRSPMAIQFVLDKMNAAHSMITGPPGKYAHEPRCAICGMRETRCRYMCSKTMDRHQFTETD